MTRYARSADNEAKAAKVLTGTVERGRLPVARFGP